MRRSDVGMNTRVELATDGSGRHAEHNVVHLHAERCEPGRPAAISFSDVSQFLHPGKAMSSRSETISLGCGPRNSFASSDQAAAENRPSSDDRRLAETEHGQVLINGQSIAQARAAHQIAWCFKTPFSFLGARFGENVELPPRC